MSHSASVNQHFGCRFLFRKGKTIFAYSSFRFTEMVLVVETLHPGRQRTTILPWLPAEYLYGGNVRNQGISRPDMNIFSCRNNLVLAAECSPFIREAVKIGIIWSFTYICLDIVILPMSRGCKLPIYSVMITSLMYDNGVTWWRHQMEPFSALLTICAENSPVPGEFPAQRPVTRSFDVFFDLQPNKRLSKQWWGWWFETPPCPLRRHRNEFIYKLQCMYMCLSVIMISYLMGTKPFPEPILMYSQLGT